MRERMQAPGEASGRPGVPVPVPMARGLEQAGGMGVDRLRAQVLGRGRSQAAGQVMQMQRRYGNRWVQRALGGGDGGREVEPGVEAGIDRKRGGGQGLGGAVQAQMESAFGADFGGVRVHTDGEADQLNREVNAVAFTTGRDIFFSQGTYAPGTTAGRELLAHELTHVVQQEGAGGGAQVQGRLVLGEPGDAAEREAESVGRAVSREAVVQRECSCGGGECGCGKGHEEGVVQMRAAAVQRWPGDGMLPPGDCSVLKYAPMRAAVEAAKAVVFALGRCEAGDSCDLLAVKIAAFAAEIAARVALMTTCFKGGDTTHRGEVQTKINALNRCWKYFVDSGINCPAIIAAKVAKAAALTAALAAAAKATVGEVAEVATEVGEVVEDVEVAGEAAEAGLTVGEVVEGLLVVLAL